MVPQTKVFVGSLPQGSKPEDLRKLFERFGVVTECDIMNRCGFVHMQTEEEATAAIRGLNNSQFNGGVITVERGRIKERGQRGGRGGGGRGGMRGGGERRGGGGPMRGRDAPYARPMRAGPPHHAPMRNGMGYERGADRGYDDRYNGYGGEDRRGFALMEGRARDPYAAAPMYDDRRGYGGEEMPMYGEERRAPMYEERDMMERRMPARHAMPLAGGYERPAPRAQGLPNGDMFSRREPMYVAQPGASRSDSLIYLRGGPAGPGGYDRDPYAQQYPPMGRYYSPG